MAKFVDLIQAKDRFDKITKVISINSENIVYIENDGTITLNIVGSTSALTGGLTNNSYIEIKTIETRESIVAKLNS